MAANIVRLNGISDQTNVISSSSSGIVTLNNTAALATPLTAATVGSNPGQVNRSVQIQGAVVSGTPLTLNLTSGEDQFSVTIAMVHLGRLHVLHNGSTGKLTVGGGTHPVMGSDQVTLQPGGSAVFDNCGFGYQVASGAVTGVEPVEAMVVADTSGGNGSGGIVISYMGINTSSVTYSTTLATFLASLNTAFNTSFGTTSGTGNIVASGASFAAIVITGTAGNYQYNQFGGHFVSTITGSGFTINGSASVGTTTTTTAGVAPISGEQDTITFTTDCGSIPLIATLLGR